MAEPQMAVERHTARVTSKGQVAIPVAVRQRLGVTAPDEIVFLMNGEQAQILSAASVVARTAGALRSDQPPLTPQAEKRAAEVAWAAESDHAIASIR